MCVPGKEQGMWIRVVWKLKGIYIHPGEVGGEGEMDERFEGVYVCVCVHERERERETLGAV